MQDDRIRAPRRLGAIDALRGFAALVVLMFHYTHYYPQAFHEELRLPHVYWGQYGIDLFFMISGFVILMTLERTQSVVDFTVSRFSRLYPAYWVCVVLTWIVVRFSGIPLRSLRLGEVLANFTMVHGALGIPHVDGVYWTLHVELSFYILMGGMLALGRLRQVEWLMLVLVALHLTDLLLLPGDWQRHTIVRLARELLILDYAALFGCGILVYRIWSRKAVGPVSLLFALFLIASVVGRPPVTRIIVPASTLLLWLACRGRLDWLCGRWVLLLGAISYPLYLLHQNIGYCVIYRSRGAGLPGRLSVLLAVFLVIGLAALISFAVEYPAMRLIRSYFASIRRLSFSYDAGQDQRVPAATQAVAAAMDSCSQSDPSRSA